MKRRMFVDAGGLGWTGLCGPRAVLRGRLGFRLGDDAFEVGPGSAVLARRGTPHTSRNAGDVQAELLLVMPPRIASLIEAIHERAADVPALFKAHASEILG
jgi:hypothetical protein